MDAIIKADPASLYRVFSGRLPIADALSHGGVAIEGPRSLLRSLWRWLGLRCVARQAVAGSLE